MEELVLLAIEEKSDATQTTLISYYKRKKTAQATHAKQLTPRQLRANFELELMD